MPRGIHPFRYWLNDNQYSTHVIAYIIFASLLLSLVGLVVLNHAIKRAPVGFEDAHGFHEGINPRRSIPFDVELRGIPVGPVARPPKEGFRTRRFLARALGKSVGHSS